MFMQDVLFMCRKTFISAALDYFLGHQLILYDELMVVCKDLEAATELGYSAFQVESDSATMVS